MTQIRVPEYVSSQSVPGGAPYQEATGAAFGQQTAQIVAQGGENIKDTALLAQRHIQYIEAEKARQDRADKVANAYADATRDLNETEKRFQQGYVDPATGKRIDPVGSANYMSEWYKAFDEIKTKYVKSAGDDSDLQALMERTLTDMGRQRSIHADHYSTTLNVQEQKAEDFKQADNYGKLAAQASTPEERDRLINAYKARLEMRRGSFGEDYIAQRQIAFDKHAKTEYMRHLLHTDPMKFQIQYEAGAFKDLPEDTQKQALSEFRSEQNAQATYDKKIYDDNRQMGRNNTFAQANYGALTAERLERIKSGNDPYLDAHEYDHIRKLNDNAPDGVGTQQVRALRDEYLQATGYRSLENINKWHKAANELSLQLGRQHPELTKFQEELKSDWRSMVGMDRATVNQNIKKMETDLGTDRPKSTGIGFVDKMIKDADERRVKAGKKQVLEGADPKQAADSVRRAREADKKRSEGTMQGDIDSIQVKP